MNAAHRHILLVEDNEHHALLISRQLRKHAGRVTLHHVESLADASAFLTDHAVDAILLDLYLPDGNGLETVTKVVGDYPAIPVIVLTSLNDEATALEALQHGAQDYLSKDEINPTSLFRSIRYGIERKRLGRVKDEFVSIVSHELRTPVTSIYGSLGIISSGINGEYSDLLGIARRNCERLIRLINDLLDFQKMESGEFEIVPSRIDLIPLLQRALEANTGYADQYNVNLRFDAEVESVWVEADADRLLQVMANLISNAAKFSPHDGVVSVGVVSQDRVARVNVVDQGEGIGEEHRDRIFQKFTQVDSTISRSRGGTGLGLSISKQIIELHGGRIGYDSVIGEGTTFYFELPIVAPLAEVVAG